MNNRDVYQVDPSTRKLVNEGVANVNDDKNKEAMEVLRYELDTFVCDGQYEEGLRTIIETYLRNLTQANQPAVWVSGFYGSGKSHLVKMLRALWEDTKFEDGATARGIANLSQDILDLLRELSNEGKRHGGLHAVSGTLGSGASGSVRLALLGIVFKSIGLPEQYHLARFMMWLKDENIYETVRNFVESEGYEWEEELANLYVAEGLHKALVKTKSNVFPSPTMCAEILYNQYPYVKDVSNDEMVRALQKSLSKDKKFPLTLIVLDEVQQFIGEDMQRSIEVQETVEACCKNVGGKLLFIGTGQTAVTATSNLKKLEGRFTIRVELSDNDVDAVVRKVILAKRAESITPIKSVMEKNMGEISRHLTGTTIGNSTEDNQFFVDDYPILPVRRRFWETTLRVLDQTGTDSQLRNQLSMIHKVIQTNLEKSVGNVIAADYLYFDSAEKLLQARILPRNVYEKTMSWIRGTEDEQLWARASGLIFLINKLAGNNNEVGIKATIDTIADLLVENLSEGSSALRARLNEILDKCPLLMKVGDEFRIQTKESSAWNDEFQSQRSQLSNTIHRVDAERNDRFRHKFGQLVKRLNITQGNSKVNRTIYTTFDSQLPTDYDKKVYVWVRDGWGIDENSVIADARQAGNNSSTIFVYIPKRSADDLRHNLIEVKAAKATLEKRGVPNTPEGQEARSAMETVRITAESRINELIDEAFQGARIFQAGGNEILSNGLQEAILTAATNSYQRLFPQFHLADHPGWEKVYTKAKQGAPDALKAVDFQGEPQNNPVCKAILGFIAGGKKGVDIRSNFENETFGWSGDAVDGALQVLLVSGHIRAANERGDLIEAKNLERKLIGKLIFKVESTTISTAQRIQVRKLLQKLGIQSSQNEELKVIPEFLQRLTDLAKKAGGEAPKPINPDITLIENIRRSAGNDQILSIYNNREDINKKIDEWSDLAEKIEKRWGKWEQLKTLMLYGGNLKETQDVNQQIDVIEKQRLLLAESDLISTLLKSLEDALRRELTSLKLKYKKTMEKHKTSLIGDLSWQKISMERQDSLLKECGIEDVPDLDLASFNALVSSLSTYPISSWNDRIDALPGRFNKLLELVAKELEPKTQTIEVPRRTLRSEVDIQNWINELEEKLKDSIKNGPIVLR
ncbi:BREX system P-loop protein BrxC [Neobacillus niacini]|uniref:BREX system P-loop protein BrxC n=1 Tax=Neobacillus niacini TaxID=86668 RepID=UPI001C8D188F|nr:BREX system P-loop protein BrxC [Neobacillus niacini]MBY0147753.1 BREX system P-loop protein BrxC [Neobacillus niacini]